MAEDEKASKSHSKKLHWTQWLKKDNLGKRLFIGFLVMMSLAAFLHFREVRIEVLELGMTAKRYVVAQVDFEFPDQDSTIVMRQESLKDIGLIYQINDMEIKERRFNFENFLIHHQNWREQVSMSTFEEMNKIADGIEDKLFTARFTDYRTLKKMQELKLNTNDYFIVPPHKGTRAILPQAFWNDIKKRVIKKKYPSASIDFIANYFEKFQWTLDNDLNSQKKLREVCRGKCT